MAAPKSERKKDIVTERARPPSHESREQAQRPQVTGTEQDIDFEAAYLKAPPPRPGMDQRWVRSSVLGKDDVINVQRMYGKGWKPRPLDSIPGDWGIPTQQHGRFAGALVVEGMVLCERSKELSKKHRAYLRKKNDDLSAAIDAELRGAATKNPAFGPITRQARTIAVRERPVAVQDDEAGEGQEETLDA